MNTALFHPSLPFSLSLFTQFAYRKQHTSDDNKPRTQPNNLSGNSCGTLSFIIRQSNISIQNRSTVLSGVFCKRKQHLGTFHSAEKKKLKTSRGYGPLNSPGAPPRHFLWCWNRNIFNTTSRLKRSAALDFTDEQVFSLNVPFFWKYINMACSI